MYDAASSILQQKLAQIDGVGLVHVGGGSLPAVRVDLNPTALEQVRHRLGRRPPGLEPNEREPPERAARRRDPHLGNSESTTSCTSADDYLPLIVSYREGRAVRLSDIATVEQSVEDVRTTGMANGTPAVLIDRLSPAGGQHHRNRRSHSRAPASTGSLDSREHDPLRVGRPHTGHPGLAARRRTDAGDLRASCDPRRVLFPSRRPGHVLFPLSRCRCPYQHVWRDVPPWIQSRQPLAHGVDDRHWIRRRRRDCRAGKYQPVSGAGHARACRPPLRGAREITFTVLSMTLSLVAVFRADPVHGRHDGPAVPRICRDALGGDSGLARRVAHHDAHDVRQGIKTAQPVALTDGGIVSASGCLTACEDGYAAQPGLGPPPSRAACWL